MHFMDRYFSFILWTGYSYCYILIFSQVHTYNDTADSTLPSVPQKRKFDDTEDFTPKKAKIEPTSEETPTVKG